MARQPLTELVLELRPPELQPRGVVLVCAFCHRENALSYDDLEAADDDERGRCATCGRQLTADGT